MSLPQGNIAVSDLICDRLNFVGAGGSQQSVAASGGTIIIDTTEVGNVGGGADILISGDIPANIFSANGQGIKIDAWGIFAATANTKTLDLLFGGTTIVARGALVENDIHWWVNAIIMRTGVGAQDAIGKIIVSGANPLALHTEPAEDETDAINIHLTATSGGAADDDIVQHGLLVRRIG